MAEARKVHVLDDNREPTGPVLCGKTSTQVLGETFEKDDRLCRKCAIALMARANEYAEVIDDLTDDLRTLVKADQVQRRQLAKKDKMLGRLLELFLDADTDALTP